MHSRWKLIFSTATCAVLVLASSCGKHPTKPAVGQMTPGPPGTTVLTPACQVTPSPLAFGLVAVGSTSDLSFTITNTGGGTLIGTVGAGEGIFTVVSGAGSYSLTAGQGQPVTVRFAPTVAGVQQYVLPLGSTACTDLTCTGTGTAGPMSGEMVFVPAGNFTMGSTTQTSERPVHTVYLSAFYIDKYEVTNAQFKLFIDADGYTNQAYWSAAGWTARTLGGWTQPYYWRAGTYHSGLAWSEFPVVGVSWYEAEAYANFAGKRLPTEAEWEKAARGADQRTYPWGEGIDGSRANYLASGDPYDGSGRTTPVGFYDGRLYLNFQTTDSPSFYGAYDMAGNVWEWVADWYGEYSAGSASNPTGPLTGSYRVLRGGGWYDTAGYLRSAYRYYKNPDVRDNSGNVGFRCARTLP